VLAAALAATLHQDQHIGAQSGSRPAHPDEQMRCPKAVPILGVREPLRSLFLDIRQSMRCYGRVG